LELKAIFQSVEQDLAMVEGQIKAITEVDFPHPAGAYLSIGQVL